jgi:AcrR family transcriptional regulator
MNFLCSIFVEGYDRNVTATESRELPLAASRRRGAALEDAILEAAFAELTEVGYTMFSVESVAGRARTGKASIYRRWPTKQDLVMDALEVGLPTPEQCGFLPEIDPTITTRDALHEVARRIASVITSPAGDAMRAIKCEALSDPQLAKLIDDRFQAPRRAGLIALLERGIARGEVRSDAATPLVADVIPAVLLHRVIMMREPLDEHDVAAIMDQVFIPLVEAR